MLKQIRKCLGYGQLWHRVRFRSSKEPRIKDLVKNGPGFHVVASPGHHLVRFWPNASGREVHRWAKNIGPGSGKTPPARYQFPTFSLGEYRNDSQHRKLLSSRLTALACDSTWVISFLWRVFEYPPKWCTYSGGMAGATWNCCHIGAFCVHHTTMHHVTSCKATCVRCMHI